MAAAASTSGRGLFTARACNAGRLRVHRGDGARHLIIGRASSGTGAKVTYMGAYGPWQIEPEDEQEVFLYRLGLNVAAAATVAASAAALSPEGSLAREALTPLLDPICAAGAAGLGLSLVLIHIYLDVMKKAIQAMWLVGAAGGAYLMATQDVPAAQFVAEHAWATWLVGPLFAALTGIAFKETLCYRKWESLGLFFVTPALLLGHLAGALGPDVERAGVGALAVSMVVFAGRKWVQPVKDDIGDKSVFQFLKMGPEEQERLLEQRRAREQAAAEAGAEF